MLKEIEGLLVLQDRDRKIRTLKNELKVAPQERKQLDEKLTGTQATLEATRLKGRTIEVERKKLENEVQSKRDQIAKYKGAQLQTRKNEEFQAMSTAIEHLEADISKLEDRELELMEGTDTLKPELAQAEEAASATKASVARQHKDLDAKIAAVGEQIKTLEGERAKLSGEVEEDLLDLYDRLFATKGEAVVPLENGVCTGCHMGVTASTSARTKGRREVVQCEQCNRILYFTH